jgi:chromosomal replication initiation ATPase DnaA
MRKRESSSGRLTVRPSRVAAKELFRDNGLVRKVGIYLLKKHTGMTNREIGELFGTPSYSAVAKTCERFSEQVSKDSSLRGTVEQITTTMSHVRL